MKLKIVERHGQHHSVALLRSGGTCLVPSAKHPDVFFARSTLPRTSLSRRTVALRPRLPRGFSARPARHHSRDCRCVRLHGRRKRPPCTTPAAPRSQCHCTMSQRTCSSARFLGWPCNRRICDDALRPGLRTKAGLTSLRCTSLSSPTATQRCRRRCAHTSKRCSLRTRRARLTRRGTRTRVTLSARSSSLKTPSGANDRR